MMENSIPQSTHSGLPTLRSPNHALMLIIGMVPVLAFMAGLAAGVGVTLFVLDRTTKASPAATLAQAQEAVLTPAPIAPADSGDAAKAVLVGAREYTRLGKADAPVQLVIFADPQCPYCKKLSLEAEQQIIETYVKSGQAAITYRHNILFGDESMRIAQAMECAGQQGQFWAFNRQAFEHQFPENSGQATNAAMLEWAETLKLDTSQFKVCLNDSSSRQGITADLQAAQQLRIQGTPMTFVNGKLLSGALPFEVLSKAIEDQLSGVAQ